MADRPTGTVTFLFTDVEGSTRLWQEHPEAMRDAMAQHDRLLRDAVDRNGGHVFSTGGDSFAIAFADPLDAVRTALDAQHALSVAEWGEFGALKVRMALDTGLVQHRDGDYFGPPLNRVARIEELAHGGHVLLSDTTADLVRYSLPEGFVLEPIGEQKLRDVERRVRLFRLQPENAGVARKGLLLGGLIASGALLAVITIGAVVLATRSPSATQPVTASTVDQSAVDPAWSVPVKGLSAGPFVYQGGVYAIASDESTATLFAIDAATGNERWRFEAQGVLKGTLHTDGKALYFLTGATRRGDLLWVIDPADGSRVLGCGLELASTDNTIAVTPEAVYALSAGGPLNMIPTDSAGSGRCHDMATENRRYAKGLPISAGPIVAGSSVLIGDSRNIYELAADDLAVIAEYFPAAGRVEGYRGAASAINADAVRIQSPTTIIETVPVFAVDGEGLLHSSPDGVRAMAASDKTVVWPPLVDHSAVILIDSEGTLASRSHELSAIHWQRAIGTIRDAQLHDGVVYVTHDAGFTVIDAATGEEIWALETPSAAAATGAAGWIYVRTAEDEITAYALNGAALHDQRPEPIPPRDIVDPVIVAERFYAAFSKGDQAAVFGLLAADADMFRGGTPFDSSLLKEERQDDLAFWWDYLRQWGYEIEVANCSITEETELAAQVTCDAVRRGRIEDILGTPANGFTRLWIAEGLVQEADVPGTRIDDWWLEEWGFSYLPTPSYEESVNALVDWADDRYGDGWGLVCEESFARATTLWGLGASELASNAECAALAEKIATEYVAAAPGS